MKDLTNNLGITIDYAISKELSTCTTLPQSERDKFLILANKFEITIFRCGLLTLDLIIFCNEWKNLQVKTKSFDTELLRAKLERNLYKFWKKFGFNEFEISLIQRKSKLNI